MDRTEHAADERAIEKLIERQFASLCWTGNRGGDWDAFAGDFFPGALLFPAARPAKQQSVRAFVERLSGLAGSKLREFHERKLGSDIRVYGNIAVAVTGCEITENGDEVTRGVEMLLLVKSDGKWHVVAQAWDMEPGAGALPDDLELPPGQGGA